MCTGRIRTVEGSTAGARRGADVVDEPNWAEAEWVREQIRVAPQLSTDSLPDRDAQVREFERIHAALDDAVETWFRGV